MNNPVIAPIYQYYAKDPYFRYKFSVRSDVKEGWTKDGTAFFAFGKQQPGVAPVYEYYDQKPKYRFRYSTSPNIKNGWIKAGIEFYAFNTATDNTIPVYEYYVENPEYRFFYSTNPDIKEGWEKAGVGFYVLAATPATPVPAPPVGRYVINQSPETIERYFGAYLTESILQRGNETATERTYDNTSIRQAVPGLPIDAQFKTVFINRLSREVVLGPASGEEFPDDPAWHAFDINQENIFNFFEYVFGYRPSNFRSVPSHDRGGHEGFGEYRFCLGDGIQLLSIGFTAGNGPLRLSYSADCESP